MLLKHLSMESLLKHLSSAFFRRVCAAIDGHELAPGLHGSDLVLEREPHELVHRRAALAEGAIEALEKCLNVFEKRTTITNTK